MLKRNFDRVELIQRESQRRCDILIGGLERQEIGQQRAYSDKGEIYVTGGMRCDCVHEDRLEAAVADLTTGMMSKLRALHDGEPDFDSGTIGARRAIWRRRPEIEILPIAYEPHCWDVRISWRVFWRMEPSTTVAEA